MSANIFNTVKYTKPRSNYFDLSHDTKMSFNMGELVPTCCLEVVPGDRFNINSEQMLRMAPMIAPVMHKVDVYTHFFFVPNRILWPNWEKFITSAASMQDGVPAPPVFDNPNGTVISEGSLGDYLGLPTGVNMPKISAIPFAAYYRIWRDYYRDQNMQPDNDYPEYLLGDGDNPTFSVFADVRKRAWQHDYFTGALPFAQKGEAVTIPIGSFGTAPVRLSDETPAGEGMLMQTVDGIAADAGNVAYTWTNGIPTGVQFESGVNVPRAGAYVGTKPVNLVADLEDMEAEAATINSLRRAFKLQEWLEKNARGGTRYTESILAHFGVRSSDARLQRPEYIGGNKQNMVISEVLQTSSSDDETTPQANMAGHGISVGTGRGFSYRAEEHGYIIGIMSVMPKTAYQQGIPRHFSKFSPFDYFWPEFANIGEQEVLNREIYCQTEGGSPTTNNETFGYVPRYAEYKFAPSRVAGEFRSSLSFWHMGRIFSAAPSLNESFVVSDPTTRIFAVTDPTSDHIYAHVFNRISANRLMPVYGTPSF